MKNVFELKVEQMNGLEFNCECGKEHKVFIKDIKIGSKIASNINELLKEYKGKKVYIVEDENTYKVLGESIEKYLCKDFIVKKYVYRDKHLEPNSNSIGRLLIEIDEDTSIIVAVGSGTINDISRLVAYKMHIPYTIICTAPSMDGYASVVSPLIVDGVKVSYNGVYPSLILADCDILKNAPMYMLYAGLGDVLGKYTALCDWEISRLIKGEYYCDITSNLVKKAVNYCVLVSKKLKDRDIESIKAVTEGLILSGISIGMVNASRPASGSEHMLAHSWEMIFKIKHIDTSWLHGNFVGAATVAMCLTCDFIKNIDIEEVIKKGDYKEFNKENWRHNIKEAFLEVAPNIISVKEDSVPIKPQEREKTVLKIKENWEQILNIINKYVNNSDEVRDIMENAGAKWHPKDLGIDRELFIKTFIACKDIRNRYGILQLLEDLGLLEEAAYYVADILY